MAESQLLLVFGGSCLFENVRKGCHGRVSHPKNSLLPCTPCPMIRCVAVLVLWCWSEALPCGGCRRTFRSPWARWVDSLRNGSADCRGQFGARDRFGAPIVSLVDVHGNVGLWIGTT
eukprot:s3643_g5.t1